MSDYCGSTCEKHGCCNCYGCSRCATEARIARGDLTPEEKIAALEKRLAALEKPKRKKAKAR